MRRSKRLKKAMHRTMPTKSRSSMLTAGKRMRASSGCNAVLPCTIRIYYSSRQTPGCELCTGTAGFRSCWPICTCRSRFIGNSQLSKPRIDLWSRCFHSRTRGCNMDATLDETVERAKEEVKKLLAEVQAGQPDPKKLECGLMEVQGKLK